MSESLRFHDLVARARLEQPARSARTLRDSRLLEELARLRREVMAGDWRGLAASGPRCLGLGYAALWETRRLSQARELQGMVRSGADVLARAMLAHSHDDASHDALEGQLQERLEVASQPERIHQVLKEIGEDPEHGPISEAAFEQFESQLLAGDGRPGASAGEARVAMPLPHLPADGYVLAALHRGFLASCWVSFEDMWARISSREQVPTLDLAFVTSWLEDHRQWLIQGQQRIHAATQEGHDNYRAVAARLAADIEERLPSLFRAQAVLRYEIQRLVERGSGGAAEKLGARTVQVSALIREALASHVASHRIHLHSSSWLLPAELRDLWKAVELPFDAPWPNGVNVAIADVPAQEEGRMVEVTGMVLDVLALRPEEGQLVSRVKLQDPSSGAELWAAAAFVHMPHMGIVPGSVCTVHGTYEPSSSLLEDGGLKIDRLALAELAQESWRVAFLRSARDVYQVRRNQLNMVWSLAPHGEGSEGAADLVYPPFVRRQKESP